MEDEMVDEFGGTVSRKTLAKAWEEHKAGRLTPIDPMQHPVMSLRDWFAGQVLVGLVDSWGPERGSGIAYEYADAMLAAREDGGGDG